jgi:hypothetical protein
MFLLSHMITPHPLLLLHQPAGLLSLQASALCIPVHATIVLDCAVLVVCIVCMEWKGYFSKGVVCVSIRTPKIDITALRKSWSGLL